MKASRIALVLGLAALSAGCSGVQSRVRGGKLPQTMDQNPVGGSFIEAVGIGAADPALPSETQRKALARDAAIVKAQYEMLSMVSGVTLDGGVTVSQAMEKDSNLEASLRAVIRGAEIRKTEFTADNGCVVTLRLPKRRLQEMVGVRFE